MINYLLLLLQNRWAKAFFFFFSSRRRHTRCSRDWSSDVCSSDLEQLVKVGGQAGADVYERGIEADPVEIAAWARDRATEQGKDVLIVDTSGRLHVDKELMDELAAIKKAIVPHSVLLVVDAMTGQDAVNVAQEFGAVAPFDGVVMTKLDGDARGGAALSVKAV